MKKVFVSACLLGENCKYSGGNNLRENLIKELSDCEIIPVCPEIFGGLPTPRKPSEIEQGFDGTDIVKGKGRVINSAGEDVTVQFLKGANKTIEMAMEQKPCAVYLKQGSPSCGCGYIYDGTFSGAKKQGRGVTAAIFEENGFEIVAVD